LLRPSLHALEPSAGQIELSGRFGKSTYATVAKLRRMHTALSTVQDIAGYRIVVPSAPAQELVLQALSEAFGDARVYDRRELSSHGYRAVHVVVRIDRWRIEVQVRTVFQHLWAQLSERLCDTLGFPGIKYGDYPSEYPQVGRILSGTSSAIADFEAQELQGGEHLSPRRALLLTRLDQALTVLEE
jgi:hypothetical protein